MNVLLVEPGYRNKYPPLGLMKIAAYHRQRGHEVRFQKCSSVWMGDDWQPDLVYVTTLFTFHWQEALNLVDSLLAATEGHCIIYVGGIAASLLPDWHWPAAWPERVQRVRGLLTDWHGVNVDQLPPDYSILAQIPYRYPVSDAYFGYASRGCPRRCKFCGVPKLEGDLVDGPPLAEWIDPIIERHGPRQHLLLMDNNVVASRRWQSILAECRDAGFHRGAAQNGRKRRLDFNQGVDARILAKSDAYMRELATTCIDPLRIAFDHWGLRGPYETSIRQAAACGLSALSNYMLYNFHDTPADLYRRLRLTIDLNEELGLRIWSFPMRYCPVDRADRGHIGPNWTAHQLRSIRVLLRPSGGVVGGKRAFFDHCWGRDETEFLEIISRDHRRIEDRSLVMPMLFPHDDLGEARVEDAA